MRGATTTKTAMLASSALVALLAADHAAATTVNFVNQCSYTINLYDNSRTENIASGGSTSRELPTNFSGMYRHGTNDQATLVEIAIAGGRIWYDLSAIPPGSGSCKSYADCKQLTNKSGFNVPVAMQPQTTSTSTACRSITCESDQCSDAYLFPTDDTKTHDCADSVTMNVIFCPSGKAAGSSTPAPTSATPAPTTASPTPTTASPAPTQSNAFSAAAEYESGVVNISPAAQTTTSTSSGNSSSSFPSASIKSSFSYKGAKAGSGAGSYSMVTNTKNCVKETVTINSPVGPLSEEVTMVFRGPMEIFNIAVFDGSAGGDWKKVSSYDQSSGATTNMLFMDNKNVDYNTGVKSPQGFATADGLGTSSSAQTFSGKLSDASNPSQKYGGPGVTTGAEVNIMTSTKCSASGTCKGYYDDNGYHGWDGGKKMFVTTVKMPTGSSPNQPAIWMLNAQIVRSNQYGCNCRGMGAAGGCGELDIAEVIETNDARDKVTTHYYFYDGSIAAGGDNFAARPTDAATTYITIIDESSSTVKVLEIGASDFDYTTSSVASSQIEAWISASDVNLIQ